MNKRILIKEKRFKQNDNENRSRQNGNKYRPKRR